MTRPYLGPCKHCHAEGEEHVLFIRHVVECEDGDEYDSEFGVRCANCGVMIYAEYREEAANLWNGVVPVEEPSDA